MMFEVLPNRTGGAAENMATDFLLLQRYPREDAVRFRHYGWRTPAFTFGYSQKRAFIQTQLPADASFELVRRATGGGLVDHRDDWTFALVIPRGHPLEELRATQSYREVHEALAAALRAQGVAAVTKQIREEPIEAGPAGVCFQRAEVYDVVNDATGEKIAGAAQKRNKRGLLFQGSIWRPAVVAAIDWEKFHDGFVAELGRVLNLAPTPTPWPEFSEDELAGLVEQYSATEWNDSR